MHSSTQESVFAFASSEGSGKTAQMRGLARSLAARQFENFKITCTVSSFFFLKKVATIGAHGEKTSIVSRLTGDE